MNILESHQTVAGDRFIMKEDVSQIKTITGFQDKVQYSIHYEKEDGTYEQVGDLIPTIELANKKLDEYVKVFNKGFIKGSMK